MPQSGTSAPKRPPCVETAVSRLGRTFRISTTSVSPGSAPSIAIGPTSPGHLPPAFSYHSPQSVSLSSTSPGFTVRTGGRTANVGWPTVGFSRCVSAAAAAAPGGHRQEQQRDTAHVSPRVLHSSLPPGPGRER